MQKNAFAIALTLSSGHSFVDKFTNYVPLIFKQNQFLQRKFDLIFFRRFWRFWFWLTKKNFLSL